MTDTTAFTLTVDQNKFVPPGTAEMAAVLGIECRTTESAAAEVAEVIVIDRSPSMGGVKLAEAKRAAKAALDALREDAYFAIVAGGHDATQLYPGGGALATAIPRHRKAAANAIDRMTLGNLTYTGVWLRCAADLLASRPGAIGHVLLLTDGMVNQDSASYTADLDYCEGRFACDAVGIGIDWDPDQLKHIADRFQGTRAFIEDLADLTDYFTEVCGKAMGKAYGDVALLVRTPADVAIGSLRQVYPTLQDLAGHRRDLDARSALFPLAAWGTETREYMLDVAAPAWPVGEERRAAQVLLVRGPDHEVLARGNLLVCWTDDPVLNTEVNAKVAVHTGQEQLAAHVRTGLAALRAGDPPTATRHLATARTLAEEAGNRATARLIERIIDFDPGTGTARLKQGVTEEDRLAIDVGTDRTVRTPTSRTELT
ncbi:von Willebrand factor type A domain-containing protein [Glycomyces sambucus]|uniref:von Willebrand factor type A domain-containing protein n=1 Tax=Glycomyces sambucus TaxID=380244 RepID=A0A1G9I3H1_9ACTN|nr:VWA domain-containing protein [Glycomyces sambucus]SDL19464.1 von Willebrand factor type A domain-containing protein [Glycomyces sambucus]